MFLVVFVAAFLLTMALVRWQQRRGTPRAPRPADRARPAIAVLALLAATVAVGVVDTPHAAGVVVLAAIVVTGIAGRVRKAHRPPAPPTAHALTGFRN